ncbi:hypothetical protein EDB85DRAFT_1893350 [Lactarius pseudohatsudake]|nr:hypothetical protein EDB85DRAFT_1893350 [Lactarius pseudohatsudake]
MSPTNLPAPNPVPPMSSTSEQNSEPTAREKSTTAARVAISSGPAASTVEARKGKNKRDNSRRTQGRTGAWNLDAPPTVPTVGRHDDTGSHDGPEYPPYDAA